MSGSFIGYIVGVVLEAFKYVLPENWDLLSGLI